MPRRKAKKRKLNNEKVNNPSVDFNEPQPTEHPPRLERFLFHDSDIEFVSLLSAENPGSHSHVFDVVIESKHYALKIARPFSGCVCVLVN